MNSLEEGNDKFFTTNMNALKDLITTIDHSSRKDNQTCTVFLLTCLRNYIDLWKTLGEKKSPPVDIKKELDILIESLEDIFIWISDKMSMPEGIENERKEQNGRIRKRQERRKKSSRTDSSSQNNQHSDKDTREKTASNNKRKPPVWLIMKNRRRLQQEKEQAREMGIFPTDFSLLKLITDAISKMNEECIVDNFAKSVLAKFVTAMEMFASYGKTHDNTLYEKSILLFSEIPKVENYDYEKSHSILNLVRRIKNFICRNYPKFHNPPANVIDKILLLVQSLKELTSKEESSTKEQDSDLLETSGAKKQLNEQSLSFIQSKENILQSLKKLTNNEESNTEEQDSDLLEVPGAKKQLNEQCLNFIQSKENILERVTYQVEQSEAYIKNKDGETMLLADLRKEIETIYPKHKLYVYGSQASGQALPDSDFDIYCDITGDNYEMGLDHNAQKSCARELASQFQQNLLIFSDIIYILDTKVPIVKLIHNPTGLKCDISFKDGTTVENTQLLKVYLDLDPRVHWLLTAVKLWAHYNQIIGPGNCSSSGINWLVLFYLMKEKVVPPVVDLQTPCETRLINKWNVAFQHPEQWELGTQASEIELFKGFFTWVIEEDLTSFCLCTFTGELIPKDVLADINKMKLYNEGVFKEYAERLEMERPKVSFQLSSYDMIEMNGNSGLCVQDPFEHNKNLLEKVEGTQYKNFIALIQETVCILQNINSE